MSENASVEGAKAEGSRARIMRVLRNKQVRRIQIAFAGSTLGDWAFATAVLVYAFDDGGAKAVGIYQGLRFVAMAIASPLGGALADRLPSRRSFMLAADAIRAGLIGGAAVVIGVDGPSLAVYVLAIAAGFVGAPFRAAQAGLLPQLVDSPDDLTAANALSANLENTMLFAGPALAGVLIGVWNVDVVFWLNAATFVWSFLLVLGVKAPRTERGDDDEQTGYLADLAAGFKMVAKDRDLRNIALLTGSTGFTWGALTVIMIVMATEVLESGPEGVGYFNSTLGVATVIGGIIVLMRVGSNRLAEDMVYANLCWGIPLLVVAVFPHPITAFAALAVLGLGEALGGLGFETIPQRIAPAEFVSRVYSAIESALIAPMFLGAFIAPFLIDEFGLEATIAIAGSVVLLVTLTRWPMMRALDRRLTAPEHLGLLRDVPTFADLPVGALERLAHTSEVVRVPAGTTVMAEGDASFRFYIIVSGQVEVTTGGQFQRTEGPGEFFGEIGLLRDVPRTATVTATEDCEFLVVERPDFLDAAGNLGDARGTLDDVVSRRLAA